MQSARPKIEPDESTYIKPPVWKKPSKTDRVKGQKRWSAKWQGMQLRVDYVKTSEVFFDGFIDDEKICREKIQSVAQQIVDVEALRRTKTRA
jgi:hypothetical protein